MGIPASSDGPRRGQPTLVERRAASLGSAYRLFYDEPIHVVRGEGVWLYDAAGERYLDAYNNVPSVGHCHPHVVQAVTEQVARLNVHTRYLDEHVLAYAERLLATFPNELGRVLFTCTGSEANDLACQLARTVTSNAGFIVTRHAYHGNTTAIAGLSPSLGEKVPLAPTTRVVPAPGTHAGSPDDVATAFAADVEAAIADLRRDGLRPAALLIDSVFSSDGVVPDPAPAIGPAAEAVRAAGGMLIADEVQAGFGRTGGMWGFLRHDVVPDIVTLGKPMGNGYPVAGVVSRADVMAPFGERSRYFNTFGGTPVAAAAGMAVLDVIEREGLLVNSSDVGGYLVARLRDLAKHHAILGEVRGVGLFIGIDIVKRAAPEEPSAKGATSLVNSLRQRRVLVSQTGPAANVLKIRPPLVFSRGDADLLVTALEAALSER